MPTRPTPAAVKYSAADEPSPPAPMTRTEPLSKRSCAAHQDLALPRTCASWTKQYWRANLAPQKKVTTAADCIGLFDLLSEYVTQLPSASTPHLNLTGV